MVEKNPRWSKHQLEERKYNYREVLENFFPDHLMKAINHDLEKRTMTEICEQIAMFGEMPKLPGEQEVEVSRIIHEYIDDLQKEPGQRRWLTGANKIILDRYVIDAYERVCEENLEIP